MESQSLDQLPEVFSTFDRDRDGYLKNSDIRHLFAAFMTRLSEDEVKDLQQSLGNGDHVSSIDLVSFLKLLTEMNKSDIMSVITEGWRHINASNSAVVTSEQVAELVLKLGLSISEVEVKEMVAHYDKEKKGGLTFEEFANMIA